MDCCGCKRHKQIINFLVQTIHDLKNLENERSNTHFVHWFNNTSQKLNEERPKTFFFPGFNNDSRNQVRKHNVQNVPVVKDPEVNVPVVNVNAVKTNKIDT